MDKDIVALDTSHGIETPSSKLYMRMTALCADMATLLPALVAWVMCVGCSARDSVHHMVCIQYTVGIQYVMYRLVYYAPH